MVLSSLPAIKDLLEKRGEKYADRPTLPILGMYDAPGCCPPSVLRLLTPRNFRLELDWLTQASMMGDYWREGRRLLDRSLGPGATAPYRRMMEDNTHMFLGQLLEAPDDFVSHIGLSVRRVRLSYTTVNYWAVFKEDWSCPSHMGMT